MTRYFVHVMNGEAVVGEVGVELPDMDKVRSEAIRAAGEMLSSGKQQWAGEAWRVVAAQGDGTIVFSANSAVNRHGL